MLNEIGKICIWSAVFAYWASIPGAIYLLNTQNLTVKALVSIYLAINVICWIYVYFVLRYQVHPEKDAIRELLAKSLRGTEAKNNK